jgi:hypothetical protein
MDIQSQSQDMLARLLATENIDVVRGRVRTAMFDILNRRLILPRWKEMSSTVEEMLMLHEVGHALFTGQEAYGVVFDTKKHLKTYANVIEDVRIEKKMKERYPGSRKSFNIGYRELNERDFFGVKARDLSQLLLIDRINLYYKVGFNCGVKFTSEEQLFLRRVDLCNTEDDVIKLAEEIYEYSKASHEEKKKLSQAMRQELQQELDDEEDSDYEDGDEYDMDDIDEWDTQDSDDVDSYEEEAKEKPKATRTGYSPQKEEDDETQLESVTANKFEETLNQFADEDLEIQYFKPRFEFNESTNPIVDYKRIIKEISDYKSCFNKEKSLKFKTTNSPVVSYLVKEFEMRKSASSMKRAKIAKLGQLDSRKLYAYKLKDDLFRQIMQVKDGKKHGMIFLLDWSGSMFDYIEETIEQVINLAMFCQRIQIPYQVFAFTDGYGDRFDSYYDQPASSHVEGGIGNGNRFTLLEFFSNKMSTSEFNKMIDVLMSRPFNVPNYGLNGTPLNESLLFMVDYIGKFIKNNAVEKMSFITLTDGESGALYSNEKRISNGSSWRYDKQGLARKINVKSYMRDPITKKDYDFSDDGQQQTSVLLNVIKDRYNTNNIGFFIMTSTTRSANNFVRHNMSNICTDGNSTYAMMEKITSSLRKQKYCILNNVSGRDEYYLLNSKARIEDSNLDSVNTAMSSSQMSKALGKVFNSRKTSRVVLNKFIGMVA